MRGVPAVLQGDPVSFTVRIYKVGRAVDCWRWLCARCLAELRSDGWALRDSKDPPHALPCDGDACREARVGVIAVVLTESPRRRSVLDERIEAEALPAEVLRPSAAQGRLF